MVKSVFLKNFKSFSELATANLGRLLVIAGPNSCGKTTIIQALLLLAQTMENPRRDVALDLGGSLAQFAEFRDVVFGKPPISEAAFTIGFNLEVPYFGGLDYLKLLDSRKPEDKISELGKYMSGMRKGMERLADMSDVELWGQSPQVVPAQISLTFGATGSGKTHLRSFSFTTTLGELTEVSYEFVRRRNKYDVLLRARPLGNKDVGPASVSPKIVAEVARLSSRIRDHVDSIIATSSRTSDNPRTHSIFRFIVSLLNGFPQGNERLTELLKRANYGDEILLPHPRTWNKDLVEDIMELAKNAISAVLASEIEFSTNLNVPLDHFFVSNTFYVPSLVGSSDYLADKREEMEFIGAFWGVSRDAYRDVRRFLRSLVYLGPLRARPERAYLAAGTPLDIGKSGENAVPILWVERLTKVMTKTRSGDEPRMVALGRAVEAWFEEFGIAHSLHVAKPKRVVYQAELEGPKGSGTKVTIADVGFGVSQLLPVILAGLRAPRGATVVFEQPEIHLHPKLQAKLADFFICLVELGKRVIVETHSEHLINTLRLRTLEDSSGELQRKVRILFVQANATGKSQKTKGSYISNLELDEYGQIVNWPPDFFPEHGDLDEKMLRAMIAKTASKE